MSSKIKDAIPHIFTLANLLLGCIAIVFAFDPEQFHYVPYLVIAAGFADFFDGFIARMLNVSSPLGVQLDSLADMITFGVVPGIAVYQLLYRAYDFNAHFLWLLPAFALTIVSAVRLAKFNIDERQHDGFIGLPTPSATMFIMALVLLLHSTQFHFDGLILNPLFLYAITALFSYLLVSHIPMFSMKFKHSGWQGNEMRYIFLVGGALAMILLGGLGIALIVLSYIMVSIVVRKQEV